MKEIIQDISILPVLPEGETCETVQVTLEANTGKSRKLYIESYGCQMNFADSEIVTSIMLDQGFDTTSDFNCADVVFLNTCSIRENAELKIRNRLKHFRGAKRRKPGMIIGVLGCMAERLKSNLLEEEKIVDMVVGPDAYRDLPNLISEVDEGQKAVNVFLSKEETYADISPVRLNSNGVSAFVSIMRGCNNMCSFCVVPFTRGRERSRDPETIVKEVQDLANQGYKEVTLLGQNVDSFNWTKEGETNTVNFAQLLEKVALVDENMRIRFSTSHPKDITDEVLYTMKKYDNICKYIHLPAQSGSNRMLDIMNRTYTREWYMERVTSIRNILGDECGISSDKIAGFCSETEEDHKDTLSLMEFVKYDYAYMYAYSERPGTLAAKKLIDDIPEEVKKRRLAEIISLQHEHAFIRNKTKLGKVHRVLVEGFSKRSEEHLSGRNDANTVIIFPKKHYKKGDFVNVFVTDCSTATLFGEAID